MASATRSTSTSPKRSVLFEAMLAKLREAVTGQLMHIELAPTEEQPIMQPVELPPMQAHHIDATTGLDEFALADAVLTAEHQPRAAAPEKRAPMQTRKAAGNGGVDPNEPGDLGPGVAQRRLAPAARARSTSIATASSSSGPVPVPEAWMQLAA